MNIRIEISVGNANIETTQLNKSFSDVTTAKPSPILRSVTTQLVASSINAWGQTTDGLILHADIDENSLSSLKIHSDKSIAIGMGITSKKLPTYSIDATLRAIPFLKLLIPSFCNTMTPKKFIYHFYLAYDKNDPFFTDDHKRKAFRARFTHMILSNCPRGHDVYLNMYQCSHNGKPAWAQNDAMIQAYLDNVLYFYRINDDSVMITSDWTEKLISRLESYDPIMVGVTAPRHTGGAETILTYDFVHKTHIDIWGIYYNRIFPDWFGDDWITKIYRPGRSTQVADVKLIHKTTASGTRYNPTISLNKILATTIRNDIEMTLKTYLKARINPQFDKLSKDSKRTISYSMWKDEPAILHGILRNIQLLPVIYPEWSISVYVPPNGMQSSLMKRFIARMVIENGVNIIEVSDKASKSILPELWNLLVIDNTNIDSFLIRSPYHRLSERERSAVEAFFSSNNDFHCLRDHPNHTIQALNYGLFGGRVLKTQEIIGKSMSSFLDNNFNLNSVLDNLWQAIKGHNILCHDSFSCNKFQKSINFPSQRVHHEHVGQNYNMHQQALPQDAATLHSMPEIQCSE
ncbi:unnamed protein product [Dimorphilus gyrociliatus]|uniref:Uncharacterized protein n=1 Tax=Dimorphilus gyrociliatus TaxID=2664684 RepID=A0A7I8W7N3_9ANNE|nr:unnamed protein product [Dimorphilus gyrociliatus]